MSTYRLPWVSLFLIAGSIATAFAQLWQPELVETFGFQIAHPSFQTALSSLFLHANTLHLLGNMVFLAAVGPAVETTIGPWRLTTTYLLGGLGGVALHWALANRALYDEPLVGASGAIAACVGLFSVRFHASKVPLAPKVNAPILAVATLWLVIQVSGAFIQIGSVEGGMAYWAHIGGFAAGLLLSVAFRMDRHARLDTAQANLAKMEQRSAGAVIKAAEQSLQAGTKDPQILRQLADAQRTVGDHDKESEALLAGLDRFEVEDRAQAIERLSELQALSALSVSKRKRMADQLKASHPKAASALLESVVEETRSSPELPDALLLLAEVQKDIDPARAQGHVDEIFRDFPMHPAAEVARTRGWSS